ncbi:MAG: BspA family leucine-rich repeat surface protein, partial [Reichenbachiella sp.]
MNQFFGLLLVSSLLIFSSTVFAQPNITSFSPTSGEVGSSVTITGVNFNPVVTDNIIYFGGIRVPNADIANVVAGSQISVIVPVGANSLSHITLFDNSTNLGDDAEQLFNVTFADGVFVNTHYDDAVEFTGSTANPREIQSGDFDGDGKMDVITYSGTSAITLFQNNSTIGTPSFTTSTIGNTVFVGLAVGDLNGDGKLDILGTQNGSGGDGFGMHMFENMSSGPGDFTFGSPVYIAHTNFVFDVEIADMDGDGKMDIIINNQGGIRVSIFKNNHSSGALSAADFSSRTNLNASSCNGAMMDIADINNDNKPDILITNHCSTVVNVYTNESTPGTMSFPSRISLTTEVASTFSVFAADFDNDGLPDILVSNGTSGNNVAVFRNTNSSPGVSSFAARIEFPFGTNARYSNVGDVDGDGKIDIIVNDAGSGTVKIMHNTSTGSGNIAFDDAEIYAGSTALVTDIDNDNFPDLVLAKGTQARLLVYRYNPGAFIMTWQTTTANESITIPTTGTGYNYTVQWGDGQSSSSQTGDATHNYTTAGTYTVSISGTFPRIYFYNSGDKTKIQTIEQWGNISWGSMDSAFYGATNLTIPALDVPDLSTVTSLGGMFYGASAFNSDISDWEVSNVTTMANMFREATAFNQDISDWDVSKLNSFQLMFREASSFDNGGVILDWENMGWDASVDTITMGSMFREATAFNQDISGWDISKVHSFARMFQGASSFNNGGVPLNWTTMGKSTNVEDIRLNFMYAGASSFNHDISDWDVSKVESFYAMFASNSSFNNGGVPLDWATMGQVGVDTVDLGYMFSEASAFNQDISTWNVSKVWNFRHMFVDNTAFNNGGGPLDWVDVGQDANVTSINLQNMFDGATAFDQDIGSWDIGKANSMADMLSGSGLSTANYDATLIGWADDNGMTETIPSGLTLGASGLNYCNAATEHAELQDPAGAYNWTITDAGVLCVPEINVYAGTDNTYSQIINDQTSDVNMTSVTYGDDLTQTIAIVNTGVIPLDVTSITASEIFTINPANASIPVGSTETFTITLLTPDVGSYAALITIISDDADMSPFTFPISGSVTKATLTAAATNQSRLYGVNNPTLTIGYTGFVNSEDATVIDTAPTASSSATVSSGVGDYTITSAGGIDANYDFVYSNGTLTINKATLTAIVDNQSREYGAADPTFTIGYTGFVNSEDESVIDTTPTVTTVSTITSGAGDYTLTPTGGADDNYNFSYTDGTLMINKATLSATVDNQS